MQAIKHVIKIERHNFPKEWMTQSNQQRPVGGYQQGLEHTSKVQAWGMVDINLTHL